MARAYARSRRGGRIVGGRAREAAQAVGRQETPSGRPDPQLPGAGLRLAARLTRRPGMHYAAHRDVVPPEAHELHAVRWQVVRRGEERTGHRLAQLGPGAEVRRELDDARDEGAGAPT